MGMDMSKRQWLRSQGFTVGERGKLSPEMHTALKEYPGDDVGNAVALDVECFDPVIEYVPFDTPKIREPRTLYGFTKEGTKVGFTTCRACTKHMTFCSCQKGVLSPIIVVRSNESEVYVSK
jgi:hypothetical protein